MSHVTWAWAMSSMGALTHARWKMDLPVPQIVLQPRAYAHMRVLSS